MEIKIDDIPQARGREVTREERVRRVAEVKPAWRRRTVLAGLMSVGTATGLAALGVFPPARSARADGYEILTWCPTYAEFHDCHGCGPAPLSFNACEYGGCGICTCSGWFRNDGVTYKLRPNQCLDNVYDGWEWRYNGPCGCCASYVTYRCHDGYAKISGVWYKRICRSTLQCGGCGC